MISEKCWFLLLEAPQRSSRGSLLREEKSRTHIEQFGWENTTVPNHSDHEPIKRTCDTAGKGPARSSTYVSLSLATQGRVEKTAGRKAWWQRSHAMICLHPQEPPQGTEMELSGNQATTLAPVSAQPSFFHFDANRGRDWFSYSSLLPAGVDGPLSCLSKIEQTH